MPFAACDHDFKAGHHESTFIFNDRRFSVTERRPHAPESASIKQEDWQCQIGKRLTSTSGMKLDVNLDAVAYLYPGQGNTTVYFAV